MATFILTGKGRNQFIQMAADIMHRGKGLGRDQFIDMRVLQETAVGFQDDPSTYEEIEDELISSLQAMDPPLEEHEVRRSMRRLFEHEFVKRIDDEDSF